MKRAIITGATGAIGMALIKKLISENVEVLVLCRKDSVHADRIPNHPFVSVMYCGLSEYAEQESYTDKSWDVFYHFAWDGTSGIARDDMYLQNQNVRYALDAVHLAKRFGCRAFIGAGSQAEYGRVEDVLKPKTPCFPENGYGIAKLCAGQMTRELCRQLGLRHIWVRILSVYGPYDGENTMVMSTIRKLKQGEVLQFTPAEQIWNYLYSSDAAEAFYLLGEKGIDRKVYVLGSGQCRPLADYIYAIRDAVNPEAKIRFGDIPYTDRQVMNLKPDISELRNDVGFNIGTDFQKGIEKILTWMNTKM